MRRDSLLINHLHLISIRVKLKSSLIVYSNYLHTEILKCSLNIELCHNGLICLNVTNFSHIYNVMFIYRYMLYIFILYIKII